MDTSGRVGVGDGPAGGVCHTRAFPPGLITPPEVKLKKVWGRAEEGCARCASCGLRGEARSRRCALLTWLCAPLRAVSWSYVVMVMPVRVYLVRHGETEWNARSTLQGQLDIPLNALGHEQAAAAGAWLSAQAAPPLASVISSDLSRASATAAHIAAALRLGAPALDARLRETHLGGWQGRSWADVEARDGAALARWRSDADFAVPGGGESIRARFGRVARALHEAALRAGSSGDEGQGGVVLVSHGGVIDDIGRLCGRVPFGISTGLRKHNCSVSTLEFTPGPHAAAVAAAAAAAGAGSDADAALRALVDAALPSESLDPAGAADALGAWRVVGWGEVAHLEGLKRALADPLADAAAWTRAPREGGQG